ncbi:MAG TPA: S9 family peptidase [Candidatus Angelobacter sp.]|nr:S9 family peptidase [Candidatus Angelobacter sp.]
MRRSSLLAIISLLTFVSCLASGPADRQPTDPKSITSAASPNAKPVPIDDLFYSRRIANQAWSPDGKEIAITTNFTGRFNLWKVNAAGGWPTQLLQSDDRQFSPIWSPDGKSIVFQQDVGGHEVYDLYIVPGNGGQPINLTNTPHVSEDNPWFSHDGSLLAYTVKSEDSPIINIAVMDWATRKQRIITDEKTPDHYWQLIDFTRDGKTIYAIRGNVPFTDASVWRIDLAGARAEELTPHQGEVLIQASSISPDGNLLLLTSGEKGGYNNVALLDLKTKKKTWITDTQWDAGSGNFSPDGRQFTYALNHDGETDMYLQTVGQTTAQKLDFPPGQTFAAANPSAFSPDGTRLLVSHEDSQRVIDLWIYDLKTRSVRQLTQSAIASLSPSSIPPSRLVYYKSFDGQIISAYLRMPFNLKRDGSNPAIVLPHGGPTGQVRNTFDARTAALASRGYICISPNVRGSSGYGLEFQKANIKDLGGGDLQDEVYATKFLLATGYVDPKKIGITGGSYGGYMTLMAIGKVPDIWAAAVDMYGVINWKTMATNADPFLQQYVKALLGDPEKDREIYENTSPLKYIRNEKAPLLVLQGENDIRVPKEESDQVVSILKQEGRTVDAHYYPLEGHGFAKRENQIDALKRTVEWFEKYMKAAPSGTSGQ